MFEGVSRNDLIDHTCGNFRPICAHIIIVWRPMMTKAQFKKRPDKIPRSEFFFAHKTNLSYLHQTWKTKRSYPNKYLRRGEFCWWTTELWTRWAIPGWVFESAWWKSWRATGNTMICRIILHNEKPEYQDSREYQWFQNNELFDKLLWFIKRILENLLCFFLSK